MSKATMYRVSFVSNNKLYEVYARNVSSSNLFGFIEVGDFVFGETSQVVVDPSEERLKVEFADVKCSYIPMHAVLRIDEVQQEGTAKITNIGDGKVTPFPGPIYTPSGGGAE